MRFELIVQVLLWKLLSYILNHGYATYLRHVMLSILPMVIFS